MAKDRDRLHELVRVVRFFGDHYRNLTPRTRKRILREVERGLENLADSDLAFGLDVDPSSGPPPVESVLIGSVACTGPRPMATGDCYRLKRANAPGAAVVRAQDVARGVARLRASIDRLSLSEGEALATDLAFVVAQLDHQSSGR